jgi:pantothenate synthetase
MQVFYDKSLFQLYNPTKKENKIIGFAPTMGALHMRDTFLFMKKPGKKMTLLFLQFL